MADVIAADLFPLKRWQETVSCACVARTGRDKIKVSLRGGTVFSVDRFRLHEPRLKPPRRIADADLDRLPWEGSGPDPLERTAARGSGPSGLFA